MIKNYFKTAWRNLAKYKIFSALNIAGLAIGMAACLLILQYVSFKLSYDQFHPNVKDIYRVANDRYQSGKLIQHGTITYSGIGPAMDNDFDEVMNHTRVVPMGEMTVINNDKTLSEENILCVENSFLSMFNFPLVAGDQRTVLIEPNTVLISETLAKRVFDVKEGDYKQVLGKTVLLNTDKKPYQVQGVFKDVPQNSHLQFEMLLSYPTFVSWFKEANYDFKSSDYWHYIQLKPGTDYKAVNARFPVATKHFIYNLFQKHTCIPTSSTRSAIQEVLQ
jgi:putative ABC transport system permease protein